MFFTCSAHVPKSAAATKPASRKIIKKAGKKSFAVDLHCHVHVPEADAIAKQTALPPRDPVLQHGSQRSADRPVRCCCSSSRESMKIRRWA